MASAALGALRVELQAELATLRPRLRGLLGFARLVNLAGQDRPEAGETAGVLAGKTEQVTRRIGHLERQLAGLEALEGDGYPGIPTDAVTAAVFADLTADVAAQQAALVLFESPGEAVRGTIAFDK